MIRWWLLSCFLLLCPLGALADSNSSVRFTFETTGVYRLGWSDALEYAGASPELSFANYEVAVPLRLELSDMIAFTGTFVSNNNVRARYRREYWDIAEAMARVRLGEAWYAHAGRILEPFGLENESRYQPMKRRISSLALGFYGFNNMVGMDYLGAGIFGSGENEIFSWALDLYIGQSRIPTSRYFDADYDNSSEYYRLRNGPLAGGGRLLLEMPGADLSMAVSGKFARRSGERALNDYAASLSLMYQAQFLEVVVEGLYGKSLDQFMDFYLQLAYELVNDLSFVARFDWLDTFPRSREGRHLRHHQEVMAALAYQFTENWRTELTYHLVTGNRFARPSGYEGVSLFRSRTNDWALHTQAVMFGLVVSL